MGTLKTFGVLLFALLLSSSQCYYLSHTINSIDNAKLATRENHPIHKVGSEKDKGGIVIADKAEYRITDIEDKNERITVIVENWSSIVVYVVFITTAFALTVLSISRVIEDKIENAQDAFLKNAYNMCFKQIALISVINLVLWLTLQTRIAKKLDSIFVKEVLEKGHLDKDVSIVEPIFESLLSISIMLLAWYIVYAIYFQFVVRRLIAWMRITDNSDVLTLSKEIEFLERRCFSPIFHKHTFDKGNFIANRYEFIDNINSMSIPRVDPGGYYFMEYLRANMFDLSVNMLKFPLEALFIVMISALIFKKTFTFKGRNEVVIICTLSIVCAIAMVFLSVHLSMIEQKLYPKNLSKYLILKHNTSDWDISRQYNDPTLPSYKIDVDANESGNDLSKLIKEDSPATKHENLFYLKSKGPVVLLKLFEITCYTFLIILSLWVYLIQQHSETWLTTFRVGNAIMGGSLLVISGLVPKVFYSLIVVSKTGMMVDLNTLSTVWESHKSNNTRHAIELIDALNLDSVVSSITRNGDTYWRHLLAKFRTSPLAIQKQIYEMWNALDNKGRGVIDMPQILRFISSQGIKTSPKKRIRDFVKVFTREQPYKLNEEEFLVMGLIIKQIIVIPLDRSQMKLLFEDVYGIPWTSPCGMDSDSLQKILKHLGIKWSEGDRRHLLDFLSGGNCDGMSAESFIERLASVEELLQPTNYNNLVSEV
ncbi:uncharacterized protein BEWA_008660 [Theileria equi strain WA]|uniref:Membrane protein, putative n=1 Tax=Theileria equi strain WA TaxID=1537102 RepID=L0B0W8_THEEQ|nr:uncharacterized protein BEWA_008660 [Theileria equi strain WA]AFZ81455.1 membrane protein, putative [Theileria equi strain WA]|eukprot:XP_004831121.1 uncharacterized protein BEWA_008660 [Theileria equi strain WA]